MKFLTKQFDSRAQIVDEEDRIIKTTVHAEIVDREGDLILTAGVDYSDYEKSPTVFKDHRLYTVDAAIGQTLSLKKVKKTIVAEIQFESQDVDADAYRVFKKLQSGTLSGFSVTWAIVEEERREVNGKSINVVTKSSIIEISAVGVPMNQDATTRTVDRAFVERFVDERVPVLVKQLTIENKEVKVDNMDIEIQKAFDEHKLEMKQLEGKVDALLAINSKNVDPEPTPEPAEEPVVKPEDGDKDEVEGDDDEQELEGEAAEKAYTKAYNDSAGKLIAKQLSGLKEDE